MQRKAREQCRGERLVMLCARAGERLGRHRSFNRVSPDVCLCVCSPYVDTATLYMLGMRTVSQALTRRRLVCVAFRRLARAWANGQGVHTPTHTVTRSV